MRRMLACLAGADVDSLVINTFEASVAPFREFLTASSSTTGDSGVNTNSNGSQRSSGRLDKPFKRTFSFSSSSADSSAYDNLDNEVITTVILEHHGCEIVADQHSNNRAHRKSQPFQISPTNDPSQNWTLSTPTTTTLSSTEDTYDSLFSSLKTSHSSSLKELCTCTSDSNLYQLHKSSSKPNHTELHRVASWPRSAPDPHRFDLILNAESKELNQELKQLPTVPPQRLLQQDFWSVQAVPESISVQELRLGLDSYYPHHPHSEIPPCVRKVIMQQLQSPTPPPHNPKMIKKIVADHHASRRPFRSYSFHYSLRCIQAFAFQISPIKAGHQNRRHIFILDDDGNRHHCFALPLLVRYLQANDYD